MARTFALVIAFLSAIAQTGVSLEYCGSRLQVLPDEGALLSPHPTVVLFAQSNLEILQDPAALHASLSGAGKQIALEGQVTRCDRAVLIVFRSTQRLVSGQRYQMKVRIGAKPIDEVTRSWVVASDDPPNVLSYRVGRTFVDLATGAVDLGVCVDHYKTIPDQIVFVNVRGADGSQTTPLPIRGGTVLIGNGRCSPSFTLKPALGYTITLRSSSAQNSTRSHGIDVSVPASGLVPFSSVEDQLGDAKGIAGPERAALRDAVRFMKRGEPRRAIYRLDLLGHACADGNDEFRWMCASIDLAAFGRLGRGDLEVGFYSDFRRKELMQTCGGRR